MHVKSRGDLLVTSKHELVMKTHDDGWSERDVILSLLAMALVET